MVQNHFRNTRIVPCSFNKYISGQLSIIELYEIFFEIVHNLANCILLAEQKERFLNSEILFKNKLLNKEYVYNTEIGINFD